MLLRAGPDNTDPYRDLYMAAGMADKHWSRFRNRFEIRGHTVRLSANMTNAMGWGVHALKCCGCTGCLFRPGWRPSLLRRGYKGRWL